MNVTMIPGPLRGTLAPPPSKSETHRVLIAAALAPEASRIENLVESEDVAATLRCLAALKAAPSPDGDLPLLDCGASGSTLRLLLPLALVLRGGGHFTWTPTHMEQVLPPYLALLDELGISHLCRGSRLTVFGKLCPGSYHLRGDISAQLISGLLFALPLLAADSEIILTKSLERKGNIDLTLGVLARFGIWVKSTDYSRFFIRGNQRYTACDVSIERDFSLAAFYLAANALGSLIDITNLNPASLQGERAILHYVNLLREPGELTLDIARCPNLSPALALCAVLREGQTTRLVNTSALLPSAQQLLEAAVSELCRLGATAERGPDSLVLRGGAALSGGAVDSHRDYRIAMMLAIAATRAAGPVTLTHADCVRKSYPDFWSDYVSLGGVLSATDGKEPMT